MPITDMPVEPFHDSVRLGVIGLGGRGRFHLERCLLHPEIRAVAVCDRDRTALESAFGLCERRTTDPHDLFDDATIDAILLAVPVPERADLGRQVLAAGKHLILNPPVAGTSVGVRSLFQAADEANRRIIIWSDGREDPDFRAASTVVRSGLIGTSRLIRFERWEQMVRPEGDSKRPDDRLPGPLIDLLDQLIALASVAPSTVLVTSIGDAGYSLTVGFSTGLRAVLTLDMASAVRLDHGWAIAADRGGYAAGRRWIRTNEGELYEVPADATPFASLEDLLKEVFSGGSPPVSEVESLRLAALIAAAERSLATGCVESVEEA